MVFIIINIGKKFTLIMNDMIQDSTGNYTEFFKIDLNVAMAYFEAFEESELPD